MTSKRSPDPNEPQAPWWWSSKAGKPTTKVTDFDLMLRRAVLAAGSLKAAASMLQWPYSRLVERFRRKKQKGWWQAVKARWAVERRRERGRRARRRRRERLQRGTP